MKKNRIVRIIGILLVVGCILWVRPTKIEMVYAANIYAIPGYYKLDFKGSDSTVEVIDEDEYGRILSRFSSVDYLTENIGVTYMIIQKAAYGNVYYYDNICYSLTGLNDSLLARNDWNKPLDLSKCVTKKVRITLNNPSISPPKLATNNLSYGERLNIVAQTVGIPIINDCVYVDTADNLDMFLAFSQINEIKKFYYVVFYEDNSAKGFEVINPENRAEEVQRIKDEVGWNRDL